jgi:hypothetical protein
MLRKVEPGHSCPNKCRAFELCLLKLDLKLIKDSRGFYKNLADKSV